MSCNISLHFMQHTLELGVEGKFLGIRHRAKRKETVTIGTFRSEDDYEYEFSILSMCTLKNVNLQT